MFVLNVSQHMFSVGVVFIIYGLWLLFYVCKNRISVSVNFIFTCFKIIILLKIPDISLYWFQCYCSQIYVIFNFYFQNHFTWTSKERIVWNMSELKNYLNHKINTSNSWKKILEHSEHCWSQRYIQIKRIQKENL